MRGLTKKCAVLGYAFSLIVMLNNFAIAADGDQKEKKMFPVQWDEHLIPYYLKETPTSVEDFKRFLDARWKEDDGSDFSFVVGYHEGTARKEKKIRSCSDLMSSFKTIGSIKTKDISLSNMIGWQSQCNAMKRILQMRESKVSHITFDVKSLLEDLSKVQIESDDETYKYYFKELSKILELKCKRASLCIVTTENQVMRIEIDAIGDFNGDGIQDAIILADSGPRTGNGDFFIGLIITRMKDGDHLKVLDRW